MDSVRSAIDTLLDIYDEYSSTDYQSDSDWSCIEEDYHNFSMMSSPASEEPTGMFELEDGTRKWYLNGQLHRDDGPAVEWADGTQEWWSNGIRKNGKLGPTIVWEDGMRTWD